MSVDCQKFGVGLAEFDERGSLNSSETKAGGPYETEVGR
jgi:hypothetical protein